MQREGGKGESHSGPKRVIVCRGVAEFCAIEALIHGGNSLLLRVSCVDMNKDGESEWLNLFLSDLDKQPLQDDAKELVLSMISSVEATLRSLAEKQSG